MLLTIQNIAKIKEANIELNGITVIAGENSTGKSTVGKTLYCMVNSFYNHTNKLKREKEEEMKYRVLRFLAHHLENVDIKSGPSPSQLSKTISKEVNRLPSATVEEIENIIFRLLDDKQGIETESNSRNELLSSLSAELYKIYSVDEKELHQKIITKYFKKEFASQINHIDNEDSKCSASLTITNEKINIDFQNNKCINCSKNTSIVMEALYYDTPHILDEMSDLNEYSRSRRVAIDDEYFFGYNINHRHHLLLKLLQESSTPINEILNEKKLKTIIQTINDTTNGDFVKNSDGSVGFKENGSSTSLNLSNLSAGLKTFSIIKRLIENGHDFEKSVLILDEPEVHLHPKWQLILAEILVLFQKNFDLTILLASHSPYFLEAIEVYSKKYNIQNKCSFYLAELDNNFATFENVDINNLEKFYTKLATPFRDLEKVNDSFA